MIPHLFVITPNHLGPSRPTFERFVELTKTPDIGLIIREPDGTPRDLEVIRHHLATAQCTPVLHMKTPKALQWIEHEPDWGLHLASNDDPGAVRHRVKGILGQSTHNLDDVRRAFDLGVDYVTLSPAYRSRSKVNDNRPLVSQNVLLQANRLGPTLALGGLTPSRYHALRQVGVWGGAVLGDVFIDQTPITAYLD